MSPSMSRTQEASTRVQDGLGGPEEGKEGQVRKGLQDELEEAPPNAEEILKKI